MTKCARCSSPSPFTCEMCGRVIRDRGVSGTVPPEKLAPNPDPTKYLKGDGTWGYVSGGPGEPCQVPSHTVDYDHTLLPVSGEKAALAGTNGTPGTGNKYVTNSDPRLSAQSGGGIVMGFSFEGGVLYWEDLYEPYVWLPDGKELYFDDATGELFVE